MFHMLMIFLALFLHFNSGWALQCYVCDGHRSIYDCHDNVITCPDEYDRCASFTELTSAGRTYNKFCKHRSISCTELCTNYGDNFGSCMNGDMATCCTGDLCNKNDFQMFSEKLTSKSIQTKATLFHILVGVSLALILWR